MTIALIGVRPSDAGHVLEIPAPRRYWDAAEAAQDGFGTNRLDDTGTHRAPVVGEWVCIPSHGSYRRAQVRAVARTRAEVVFTVGEPIGFGGETVAVPHSRKVRFVDLLVHRVPAADLDDYEVRTEPLLLLDLWVTGHARTKGSLKPISRRGARVRMVEQVEGSSEWRAEVVRTIRRSGGGDGWQTVAYAPVEVVLDFVYPRPQDSTAEYPLAAGDIDKLARNVLDALQDVGLIDNDNQAVSLHARKRFGETESGICHITVREYGS